MDNSSHFCYDCAFKHLSTARVLWTEIQNGWCNVDHISFLIGNMHAAEVHLFEKHRDLTEEIRKYRKLFWDGILEDEVANIPFDDILSTLWEYINSLEDVDGEEEREEGDRREERDM